MSVEFDWNRISPEQHIKLSNQLRDFFNEHFKDLSVPSFIRDISVPKFDIGTCAPTIVITDITDPYSEFYSDDPLIASSATSPDDFQVTMNVSYEGDLSIEIHATITFNYPSDAFISLPVKFTVTGIKLATTTAIAFINKSIFITFVGGPGPTAVEVLQDIQIESELGSHGQNTDNSSVLKNIGKFEKFILERLRDIIDRELVWPSWIELRR
ncbi:hypothetical protein CANCADRAFT_1019 [Tortispora caseinolytica NRRL Y-17796]|uniref:Mitochondrial distribution and morphology protein 12 n=1 Tax=Tortispora caseinolytica NRRL Y-17796 TaxID=767744 RepID=A0A1E4TL15_9ASCO|nr:hypothetical protein CANCADRAFT_1019 [Tortispora caseinolytica NRRL Y-17796]